jgi:hypothetical protein
MYVDRKNCNQRYIRILHIQDELRTVPSRIKEGRFKHCTAELGYKKKKKKNGKN